jgi:DnaJ like chaperone protein
MKWQSQEKPHEKQYSSAGRKNNYAKWIGGGLGWAFGGPLGAILGYMFGSMMGGETDAAYRQGAPTQSGDFAVSLLALTAAIMKADGKVKKSELDYVKRFYVQNFGEASAKKYIKMLGEIIKKDIPVDDVARQIGTYMDYSSKLQLLHYLFGIALSDGNADKSEISLIEHVSVLMGIYAADLKSIKAMFVKDSGAAYKILGVSPEATDEEIKKAFREMAKKFHPDKVSHLGEDVKKAAEEKFRKINEAYETIKKERGIK